MYVLVCFIIYFAICYLKVFRKKSNIILKKDSKIYSSNFFQRLDLKLKNLDYPYKLNTHKYILLKSILPTILSVVTYFNYKQISITILIFSITFLIPDILIRLFIQKENNKLIYETKNVNSNLILCLHATIPLKDALKYVCNYIQYKRFKIYFQIFSENYEKYKFNIKKASINLISKFNSVELREFIDVIVQNENNGNLAEALEQYNDMLDITYNKYIKSQSDKRLIYVVMGTILMLFNIIAIILYPIAIQVLDSLQIIFS